MTYTQPFQELLSIIEEEASLLDLDDNEERLLHNAMLRAIDKIRSSGPLTSLKPDEVAAVKHALTDVGDLYLHAGTVAGFKPDDPADVKEHQSRGQAARVQAATLGIHV